MNGVIRNTVKKWPGKCKMINGKARSLWVQGCVEKGNQSVELMISARRQDTKRNDWVSWLPSIQCKQIFFVKPHEFLNARILLLFLF